MSNRVRTSVSRGVASLPQPALSIGVVLLTLGLFSGCGGSDSPEAAAQPESQTSTATETSEAPPHEPVEELGGPLEKVGTITVSDHKGTTFKDRYWIGPLSNGEEAPPPATVLGSCDITSPGQAARSVFAHGKASISYTEGTLPEQVGLAPGVGGEELYGGVVAYELDGEWWCRQEELQSTSYEIQPGETITMPIWLVAEEVLNNARPKAPPEVFNSWYFNFMGPPTLQLRGTTTIDGPGAGTCYGEKYLYLYNRSGVCEGAR